MPLVGQRGFSSFSQALMAASIRRFTSRRIATSCALGTHAVGPELGNAGVHLRREAGHADHEELVQIRADDGEKLDALEERVARGPAPLRAPATGRQAAPVRD